MVGMTERQLELLTTKERVLRLAGIVLLAVFATGLMLAFQALI